MTGLSADLPAYVVVGASAGGVEALTALVGGLPAHLPAAVLIVLHQPRTGPSQLHRILNRSGSVPAAHAVDGEPFRAGRIYLAPADHHLLVLDGRARLSRGPAENGHRPAIDPLFRSAARSAGPRIVAVVLSGSRDDGTAGAATVAEHGGVVLVQDPEDALHPSMPRNVVEHVPGARVGAVADLGAMTAAAVADIVAKPRTNGSRERPIADLATLETVMADLDDLTTEQLPGRPAGFACPTCHGGLFEMPGEPTPRYRCWVGHAWSPESLLDEQAAAFEGALWMALRSLEEKAALARTMSEDASGRGLAGAAERYRAVSTDAEEAGGLIRQLIGNLDNLEGPAPPPQE